MEYPTTYEEALLYEEYAKKLASENQTSAERSPETLATLERAEVLVPRGRYRHFKKEADGSPKEYLIYNVMEDVNTGLLYVDYAAQYGFHKGKRALRLLIGPTGTETSANDSFLKPINRETYRGVRFTLIEAFDPNKS